MDQLIQDGLASLKAGDVESARRCFEVAHRHETRANVRASLARKLQALGATVQVNSDQSAHAAAAAHHTTVAPTPATTVAVVTSDKSSSNSDLYTLQGIELAKKAVQLDQMVQQQQHQSLSNNDDKGRAASLYAQAADRLRLAVATTAARGDTAMRRTLMDKISEYEGRAAQLLKRPTAAAAAADLMTFPPASCSDVDTRINVPASVTTDGQRPDCASSNAATSEKQQQQQQQQQHTLPPANLPTPEQLEALNRSLLLEQANVGEEIKQLAAVTDPVHT